MNQMNRKALILSIPVMLAVLLLGGWLLFREPKSATESQNPPVGVENPPKNAGNLQPPANVDTAQPQNPVDTQPVPEIDVSSWRTYRNEKLGFEFKLSDEYQIPENEKNIVGKKKDVSLLDPKNTEYLFNSRQGLKLSREVQTTGDSSRIRVRLYPYTPLAESDFEKWINQKDIASISKTGRSVLRNGSDVSVVSWNSICDDYSAFFIRKKYIVEFNTCASVYFSNIHGDYGGSEEDYFSAILNSVEF